MTRQQAIEQAVRNVLDKVWRGQEFEGAQLIANMIERNGRWVAEATLNVTIPAIRAEFARLTQ